MYEEFYGLTRRPFAAAPDADFTVETAAVADAIARLDRCVRQGRGIAVLTAPSGLGKTHLCQRLAQLWLPEYQVVLLPNSGFPSGRGLLQAILADLDQPYQRLKEMELRIELKAVAHEIRQTSAGLVLILDEAHRYSERLLEEIRLIANLVDSGEPLIRILLAGKPDLEDTLADPGLSALNERIGELVSLPRLTAEESRQYLDERAALAGGSIEELIAPEAVELIVRTCGGSPRCLNQLVDHALLLGYVAECRPVDACRVRDALDDLKRLPLQWQDPLPESTDHAAAFERFDGASSEGESIIEIGGLDGEEFPVKTTCAAPEPVSTPTSSAAMPSDGKGSEPAILPPPLETICDRFAKIDATNARQRWFDDLERRSRSSSVTREADEKSSGSHAELRLASGPLDVLDQIEPLISDEIVALAPASQPEPTESAPSSPEVKPSPAVSAEREGSKRGRPEMRHMGGHGSPPRDLRHATLFRDLRRSAHRFGG